MAWKTNISMYIYISIYIVLLNPEFLWFYLILSLPNYYWHCKNYSKSNNTFVRSKEEQNVVNARCHKYSKVANVQARQAKHLHVFLSALKNYLSAKIFAYKTTVTCQMQPQIASFPFLDIL